MFNEWHWTFEYSTDLVSGQLFHNRLNGRRQHLELKIYFNVNSRNWPSLIFVCLYLMFLYSFLHYLSKEWVFILVIRGACLLLLHNTIALTCQNPSSSCYASSVDVKMTSLPFCYCTYHFKLKSFHLKHCFFNLKSWYTDM